MEGFALVAIQLQAVLVMDVKNGKKGGKESIIVRVYSEEKWFDFTLLSPSKFHFPFSNLQIRRLSVCL